VPSCVREQHETPKFIDNHFRLSLSDSEDFGLAISAFHFEDRNDRVQLWPSRTFREFLECSLEFISAAVKAILRTAESLLASFAGSPSARFWFKLKEAVTSA